MSSDPGSGVNGTTNFIEDWGPDPWGIDTALHGSDDPGSIEPTVLDRVQMRAAEAGISLPVLIGTWAPDDE